LNLAIAEGNVSTQQASIARKDRAGAVEIANDDGYNALTSSMRSMNSFRHSAVNNRMS